MDPWVRKRLEPRRLASGAVFGVVIGAVSALMAGSEEGPRIVFYIGIALAIALIAPWILSVLYLLTQRGRAARRDRRLR